MSSVASPLLILFLGALLVLKGTAVISTLHNNVAWINLNTYLGQDTSESKIDRVAKSFLQAQQFNNENQSAWFGSGMAAALRQNTDHAIRSWSNPINDLTTLRQYGLDARRKGNLDMALTLFRASDSLQVTRSHEAHYLAGTICRLTHARQFMLSSTNQQYCSDYLVDKAHNLIVNHQFADGALAGWGGQHYFIGQPAAELSTEAAESADDHVARLDGLAARNHFGIFQSIYLSPGDQVRFKGKFRTANDENLQVRFLFISWQDENGAVQGNHAETRSESMNWTELERNFTVPPKVEALVDFYPVVFSGQGSVWIDNITVELINE
ncbi:MAG: hypothetical protein AAF614_16355 [Chloroflexota bacterium]